MGNDSPAAVITNETGTDIANVQDHRLCTDALISNIVPIDLGNSNFWKFYSIPGKDLRYEQQNQINLPRSTETHVSVYEVIEKSIFYRIVFQLNSSSIYIQVEVDGQDIFPGENGFQFTDIKGLYPGSSGNHYEGQYGGSFGLQQYHNNKWLWEPPVPILIESNMKIKMKASNSSTSKKYILGIATRRVII